MRVACGLWPACECDVSCARTYAVVVGVCGSCGMLHVPACECTVTCDLRADPSFVEWGWCGGT